MKIKILAIALTLYLIPTSTANSQGGSVRSFNPDTQPAREESAPKDCREALVLAMQARGREFEPRTQDILDDVIAETDLVFNPNSVRIDPSWLFYQNILWDADRFEVFLSDRLLAVEPNNNVRAYLAEDALQSILAARANPLCDQPVPR